jgi:hypothetical protein
MIFKWQRYIITCNSNARYPELYWMTVIELRIYYCTTAAVNASFMLNFDLLFFLPNLLPILKPIDNVCV